MHHGTDGGGGYGSNGEGGNRNGDEASYWMHRGADGNGSNARNDKPGHFPYKRIYDYTTDDSDDEHNEESKNKKKKYKTFSQRNRKNGYEKLDNSDDDEESEYETRKGPHEKDNEDKNGKSKLGSFTRNNENENSYNSDANSKENGSESESERNRKGSETDKDNSEDENNIYERHNNDYAKKRANEIEDELNRGEYSRNNSRDKDQKGKGKGKGNYKTDKDGYNSSDSEDSDDDTVDRYYVDNGQDMLIKEKMYNSHGREGEGGLEDENDANSKYKNEKVSYHFSTYMNFEDKEILSSNEIELNKMIGDDFSREMENYCHLNVPSQKTGSYLDLAFEFSRALEELRNEMLNDLIKSKKMGKTKIFNILHIIQNSTNEKKSSSKNQIYEDEDYADEANSFRDENKNPLSAKYNSIMKQYLCHLFMNNPGKNQLDRLYHHNLALGELIKPIRTKYKKLASSSISFNYELYIASSNNIFLLAHMLLLSLAYLSFNDFFVSGIKSFYSLETLLLAKSDFTFFMYNEMCNVYYKPGKFFKKDITFIPIESRPKRHTTFIGEKKMTCDLLELILNAISLINIQELHNNLTNNNVIGYENSLSFSISAIRIFSKVCPRVNSSNMLKCEFENSTLHKKQIKKTDIREKENQKNLKRAFDLLRIFAEIENNSTKGQPNAAYIKLIMEQNKYTEFYKYLFWYDSRQLIYINKGEKNKKSKNKIKYIYNDFIKRGEKLKKKLIKLDSSYKTKSNALLVFYGIIDRYANFLTKSETIRKLFLNDTSSIRHYLYLNGVHFKTSKSYLESMKKLLEELEETTNSPMKFIVRGNYIEHLNNIARNENLFYINLFILSVLSVKEPVLHYYNEKKKMLAATLSEKFASSTSAFIPHKLRRLVVTLKKGILKKKLLTTLAKIKLLQHIPAYLLENITSSIRFTTHTIATMQIIQNAKLVSKDKLSQQTKNSHFAKQIFTKGGFPSYADKLISKWYSEGFEEYKRKQIENQKMENSIEKELKESSKESINNDSTENEEEQKQIEEQEEKEREKKEDKLFFNENDKWDFYLNKELTRALGLWLDMNSNSPNNAGFVYKLVEDSKFLLENNIEDNIIFSRTLKPTKQTAFRKFFNKIISLGNMLLRKPGFKVEHALWFGAAIDIKKAFILLEKVSELHKLMHDQEGSWLINEAFIEIVDHIVDISTNKHLREPFSVSRNPGMMAINPKYATLPHDERIKEFQNSMCADHCSSVWKIISTFALQHLKNPDSLKTYEEKFSKNAFGNKIDDKDFVHNFKMILGGDAALHYFDNMLSKSMKKELKSMKYGVSLTSAFSLKLTKLVFTQMQLPYLSQMFYVQAPYFGHFIGKWQKERQKSRMKEIMSFMTLGALSAYTMLSAMDITQHAEDIGMGPAASCYTSTYPPPRQICLQSAVKTTLTNSTEAAMKSVFSVGLFASIGPYLFAPMIGLAVWNILKSEFKVLQRIDMALKNVFKNMWKKFLSLKGITKLRNIFKRKNSMKKKIIENAEHKMKEMKENPAKAKAHKMSVETMHKHSKGGYHYVSYARIQI
uniref:Rhoptry neck protein 2 n=1 Tax=Plasmodium gallinaceum TaxID=5849 RepID=A0A097F766_PLAGA|nr:rhoptry neck protein 2 [Plasmodium gallinaceum]